MQVSQHPSDFVCEGGGSPEEVGVAESESFRDDQLSAEFVVRSSGYLNVSAVILATVSSPTLGDIACNRDGSSSHL